MKVDGECHCGDIAFEAEVDLASVGICHCKDCQVLSASVFRTIAIVPADLFRLIKGQPKEYIKISQSGNKRVQAFCANCGSGLYATDADKPKAYNIRVGATDQRHELIPKFEVWCQSALSWLPENGDTIKYERSLK